MKQNDFLWLIILIICFGDCVNWNNYAKKYKVNECQNRINQLERQININDYNK